MRISPETIYQSLYNPEETGLSRDLAPKLRTETACQGGPNRPVSVSPLRWPGPHCPVAIIDEERSLKLDR